MRASGGRRRTATVLGDELCHDAIEQDGGHLVRDPLHDLRDGLLVALTHPAAP
jgi:hypothetical protein